MINSKVYEKSELLSLCSWRMPASHSMLLRNFLLSYLQGTDFYIELSQKGESEIQL